MMYTRLTNWFDNAQSVGLPKGYILADLPANFVHIALSTLESRRARSIWASQQDYEDGVDALYDFMSRLLMDATDRIVNEVRALRDGNLTPELSRDAQLDPYTLSLTSLATIKAAADTNAVNLETAIGTTNTTLAEIRDLLNAQGGEDLQGILDKLDEIAILLAVL